MKSTLLMMTLCLLCLTAFSAISKQPQLHKTEAELIRLQLRSSFLDVTDTFMNDSPMSLKFQSEENYLHTFIQW